MKKIILFLFLSLFSLSGFSQNYPIKTFFKEDSVVIMTIHQFEGLDLLLKNQIEKSIKHKNIIDSLQKTIADRNKIINTYSQINDSLLGLNIQNKTNAPLEIRYKIIGGPAFISDGYID